MPSTFTYNKATVGGGLFNVADTYSLNHAPDLIAKVAHNTNRQKC